MDDPVVYPACISRDLPLVVGADLWAAVDPLVGAAPAYS